MRGEVAMSKRGSRISKLQQNYLEKGRGQGVGSDYQPFIQAHDNKVASEGWIARHKGWKTGRIHHTLSELERKYLYYCEWLDGVIDIREQFPMLPMEKTIEIAKQLRIKHAQVDDTPVVMTTDFRLTLRTKKGNIDVIRTIKPSQKLDDRTIELFEIERRYFEEQGIDWAIVTESKIPHTLVANIEWLCEAKYLETRPGLDEEFATLVSRGLLAEIIKDSYQTPISKLCLKTDDSFGLALGTCMFILKYMLANKKWVTDINSKIIRETEPMKIITLEDENKVSLNFA